MKVKSISALRGNGVQGGTHASVSYSILSCVGVMLLRLLMLLCVFSGSVIISQPNSLMDQGPCSLSLRGEWIWKLQPAQVPPKVLLEEQSGFLTRGAIAHLHLLSKHTKRNSLPLLNFLNFHSVSFLFYFIRLNVVLLPLTSAFIIL